MDVADTLHPNNQLRQERIGRNWRQQDLADQLGTTAVTVRRWERGSQHPSAYFRVKLCALFGKSAEELGLGARDEIAAYLRENEGTEEGLRSASSTEKPSIWTVPYRRNLYFTGRDDLLHLLDEHLSRTKPGDETPLNRAALSQPHAMKGLGGIGKTQIAVEYAFRAREQGQYRHTLWINAANAEALISSFTSLANALPGFAAKEETNQQKLVEAIKRWIEHCKERWLLIFDNADDLSLVQEYVPSQGNGSILLTTRATAVGSFAASINVETMGFVDGTHLLLRRAQREAQASDEEVNEAGNIVVALDHFPLALEQAGAYIEETGCSFENYLQLYQTHRKILLAKRGAQSTNYPDSVVTTWSLSFEKIEQSNPAAAKLLRLCAFLAPDHIPEELLTQGSFHWPPLLQQAVTDAFVFDQMLESLLAFSLVKRLAENHQLSIHRLVQVVQLDRIGPQEQRQWAQRVILAVNAIFPHDPKNEIASWSQCLRYLEQVQACNALIQQHQFVFPEAADLLDRAGTYFSEHALYTFAEPLYQQALRIREQQEESHYFEMMHTLNNLIILYLRQGKYEQAKRLSVLGDKPSFSNTSTEASSCSTILPTWWNIPYTRNPYFTGRATILNDLHERLRQKHSLALIQSLAVSGLGGVGKTQIALEYAYRYASAYTAVFWINAETSQTLFNSFFSIAELLALPEGKELDLKQMMQAINQWLFHHGDWLLIFDNVEDLDLLKPFLPLVPQGTLLLTTRLQALGNIAHAITIGPMLLEEGLTFLLQRVKVLIPGMSFSSVSPPDLLAAQAVVNELGGLPLALDQAGAYIEETGCEISHYHQLYQEQYAMLLNRRGTTGENHPHSVFSTVIFSLQRVAERSPRAADLLRLCAFLSPDAIPQELFVHEAGVDHVLPQAFDVIQWDEALTVLRCYALITRHATSDLLSIHRLVQVVLKSEMDDATYQHYIQQTIRMVNYAFPAVELYTMWGQCQRLLPHALACANLIEEEQILTEEAGRLLCQVGTYLLDCMHSYSQAEMYLTRSLTIRQRILGEGDLTVAQCLHNLAEVAYYKGQYTQSEELHLQALNIREQQLAPMHPDVATSLNNLAGVYWIQGRYREAEPLYRRALQIRETMLGPDHLDVAETLQNMGSLFFDQEQYYEAEHLFERSLKIYQAVLKSDHAYLITILNSLGWLYHAQGRYDRAKYLYHQAQLLGEHVLSIQHPFHAITLSNLARLACVEEEWVQAEAWYRQALQIRETVFGPENSRTAQSLHDLAKLYHERGQADQAFPLYQRALSIREKVLNLDHPHIAELLYDFAMLREIQGEYQEIESLYLCALRIWEQSLGAEHPRVAYPLNRLAYLYRKQEKYTKAESFYLHALHIREHLLEPYHPDLAETLHDFAILREAQGKDEQAAFLYSRAFAIREQVYGPEHHKTLETRECLQRLSMTQSQTEETRP